MKKYLLPLLLACFSPVAFAHPHSFLDMQNKVLIENGKLNGFAMTWILDEITSAELIYEIQSSSDKTAAEAKITAELNQSAVDNHYFSEFYDDKDTPIKFKAQPVNPSISIKDNRLFYHFELALAQPQSVAGRSFRLFSFEPSYYLYMGYEKFSDLTSTEQTQCKISLEEPKVNQQLRLYASKLDKTESPEMPSDESQSLGAQFAQKVKIECP